MSLLSGITFVKKDERVSLKSKSEDKYDKKKSKHHKSKSKKADKHHDPSRKRRRSSSSSSSGEEIDKASASDDEMLSPQAMIELSNKETHIPVQQAPIDTSANQTMHSEDSLNKVSNTDKFSDLLKQAKNWKSSVHSEVKIPFVISAVPIPIEKPQTNQSVAEQLRAKLKASKGALPPSAPLSLPVQSGAQASALLKIDDTQGVQFSDKSASSESVIPIHDRRFQVTKALIGATSAASGITGDSIAAMVAKERSGGYDMDKTYADNIKRLGRHYKGSDSKSGGAFGGGDNNGFDEEDDVNDKLFEQKNPLDDARRNVARAMLDQQRHESTVSRCNFCRIAKGGNGTLDCHLLVYLGAHIGVRLKHGNLRLAPAHCELFARDHIDSMLKVGDECAEELREVKTTLRKMHAAEGRVACFVETAVGFSRLPHAVADCVPIESGLESELQFSVQEAFTDINSEFAQNAKIFKLTHDKPLRNNIPLHFEYACAEWPENKSKSSAIPVCGLACVLQSEGGKEPIQGDFLLDVLAGLLDEDPMRMRKKVKPDVAADTREATRVAAAFRRFCGII